MKKFAIVLFFTVTVFLSAQTPAPEGFVVVKGGTFTMGSPENEPGHKSTEEQKKITVDSFYMGKYEVTQKEYQEVMGTNPSSTKGDNLPVDKVNWFDAIDYCNKRSQKEGLIPAYTIDKSKANPKDSIYEQMSWWAVNWEKNANGYRLPTEAEWEYACRAGTTTPFYTGNNITTNQANYNGNNPYNNNAKGEYRGKPIPVGSFAPNPWGLYDMSGNVWEWVWDEYYSYMFEIKSVPVDSPWRNKRVYIIVGRGGGWASGGNDLRSSFQGQGQPHIRNESIGFRIARSVN